MKRNLIKPIAPLQKSKSFPGKIDALINYLKFDTISFTVKEKINSPIISNKKKYRVVDIYSPMSTPSYLTSYLDTAWKYLENSLQKQLLKDGFYNTRQMMLTYRRKCYQE